MELNCITVDCAEPLRVAHFWNEALGWGGVMSVEDGAGAVCGPAEDGTYLEFVRVPDAKAVKNRVHLGCGVDSVDQLDAEIERLIDLGATIAWEESFPNDIASQYRNVVMRDVESNEFCLGGGTFPT